MTDANRELDAKVAEAKGWYWVKYPPPNAPQNDPLTAIVPPRENEIIYSNHYDRIWEPSDSAAKRFINWDRFAAWVERNGEQVCIEELPHYSTSMADAWALVEEMEHSGCNEISVLLDEDEWACVVWIDGLNDFIEGIAPTAPEAICRAYLEWKAEQC